MFDIAVLHGPYRAKQYYNQSNGDLDKFLDIRQKSYDKIVAGDFTQKKYYQGWNNRVNNLKTHIKNGKFISDVENLNNKSNETSSSQFSDNNLPININVIEPNNSINKDIGNGLFKLGIEKNDYLPNLNDLLINPINYENYVESKKWLDIPLANPWKKDNDNISGQFVKSQNDHIFTPSEIGQMSPTEFLQNESVIMQQMEKGLIQDKEPQTNYSGYTNPITGSGQIFTREDIGSMTLDEYSENEKAINAQLNTIGVPANQELETATHFGGVIYVRPYVRGDGTPVRGYYRSN